MERTRTERTQKFFNLALIALFCCVIWLPLADRVLHLAPDMVLMEQRVLAGMPPLGFDPTGWLEFPEKFDPYYEDHFGFRPFLVHAYNRLRSRVPGLEVAQKVLTGKEGWYYITTSSTIDDYRGIVRLTPSELAKIKDVLQDRRDWLATLGIKYLVLCAPAKWEIYPEHIPDAIRRVSEDSALEQIAHYLRENSDLEFIDPRDVLREAKKDQPVYYKTDTHWNRVGAFLATQKVNKKLADWFPGITVERLEDYHIGELASSGDLAEIMGLDHVMQRRDLRLFRKKPYPPLIRSRNPSIPEDHAVFENPGKDTIGVKAIFFHDSYGKVMYPFLSHSFSECLFIKKDFLDFDLIEKELPQVVIQECGQRSLVRKLIFNPGGFPKHLAALK